MYLEKEKTMTTPLNIKKTEIKIFSGWKKLDELGDAIFQFNRFSNSNVESMMTVFSALSPKPKSYYKKRNQLRAQAAIKLANSPIFTNTEHGSSWLFGYKNKQKNQLKDSAVLKNLKFEDLKNVKNESVIFSQVNLDNLILQKLANDLAQKYKCYVGVNGYYTPVKSKTFPVHYDKHDVLIFQVSGTKKWKISDYSSRSSSKLKSIFEVVLQPGDFIFIPAGYYHEAKTFDSASFHLTFGFHEVSINQLKRWMEQNFPKITNWDSSKKSIYNYSLLYYLKNFEVFKKTGKVFCFENKKLKQLMVFSRDLQIQLPLKEKKSLENCLKGLAPKNSTEKKLRELIKPK